MKILGISCYYHDAAACLLIDGEIVAAASEERFTRIKQDSEFPKNAIEYCLREGGIKASELDIVAFYDKPYLKFERILETYIATTPVGLKSYLQAIPLWIKKKLFIPKMIEDSLPEFQGQLVFPEHHESHAASAFLPSPFEEAAILTCDGVGEWATTTQGIGRGNNFELIREVRFPHSLGLLYSAFTYYLGFKVNSAEYKVMGAAPYGEPNYARKILDDVLNRQSAIDQLTDRTLVDRWPLGRVDATLRAIFRAAGAELLEAKKTPPKVVISEYVDVARAFWPEGKEPGLVNAVLDGMAREARPEAFA